MLVPRSRLLLWVAVIVLPFALLAAIEPAATALSLLLIGALALVAVIDALLARAGLAGLSLELPPVARLSKEREGKLELRIRNSRQKPRNLRLALAWPPEIQPAQEEIALALPGESEWSRFDWPCRPFKRGKFHVKAACMETSSPLGLWGARKTLPTQSEIRVYPNLAAERKQLAALFLHRGAFGLHAQRQIGQGRDFEKLREYIPGDSYDEIHWKATAKRGRPVTKVFQIERTQEVYVILDASRLSARPVATLPERGLSSPQQLPTFSGRDAFHRVPDSEAPNTSPTAMDLPLPVRRGEGWGEGSFGYPPDGHSNSLSAHTSPPPPTALERFITAALVLGLAAEQQGDLFGLLTFTNKVDHFVRAKNGKAHYNTCRDALYTLEPHVVTPDYDELCTFIRLRLRRRALLVFLTSLDDPVLAESFVRNLDLVRRQHLVLVNMLQPPGVAPVFTNPNVASLDDLYQHLGGHLLWQNLRELEKVLQRRGVRFSLLPNERLSAEVVSQYLNVKRRQAL